MRACIRFFRFAQRACCDLSAPSVATVARHDLEVVAYATLDRDFVEPIFEDFKNRVRRRPCWPSATPSDKTVGLAQAIVHEAKRPRCDVFWDNEILHTIRLERMGLLEEYHSPADANFPEMYRSPTGAWHGFAARARVLIVNTEALTRDKLPRFDSRSGAPEWKGKVGIAKPLFGTTATHAACLFATWGDDKAKAFFLSLKDNDIEICAGNKAVAMAVGPGIWRSG